MVRLADAIPCGTARARPTLARGLKAALRKYPCGDCEGTEKAPPAGTKSRIIAPTLSEHLSSLSQGPVSATSDGEALP